MMNTSVRNWRSPLIVGLAALILSIVGTVATLYFLSATPSGEKLRTRLGLEELKAFNIETSKSQKIIVEESSAIIDAAKKVNPAVVSITGQGKVQTNIFGLGQMQAPKIAGTGFIVTSDGLIATNKHVINGTTSITVTTAAGKSYDGKVVATDPSNDLALVKVEANGLPVADLGNSDKIEVGQWVIAIGNALGELQNSVTVGVISAKDRTANPDDGQGNTESLYGLIQTDAAINPGNSGGPLLSLGGQVVGINTAIAGGAQGIGFAIPVNDVKKDLDSYRKSGKIVQAYIGIHYQQITPALAKSLNLKVEQGALVVAPSGSAAISPGSPAEKAGLKENDIITKINSDEATESNPLVRLIRRYNPGDEVTLTIIRDGKEITLKVTLSQSS